MKWSRRLTINLVKLTNIMKINDYETIQTDGRMNFMNLMERTEAITYNQRKSIFIKSYEVIKENT